MGSNSFYIRILTLGLCIFSLVFQGNGQAITSTLPNKNQSQTIAQQGQKMGPQGQLSLWEAGPASHGSVWEWGSPGYGMTNSCHTPPTAWDVNLNTAYTNLAQCLLTSPSFNFNGIYNAQLSFYINYKTEPVNDGVWIEYSANNGVNWNHLGIVNDPNGNNWYTTSNLGGTGSSAWEGNSNGWQQVKYDLSFLDNTLNPVRFRFVFHANASITQDGVSIDDFSIIIPASQEVQLRNIVSPISGCGLEQEIVSIEIQNAGLYNISGGLTASYQVNDSGQIVTEPVNSIIVSGGAIIYSFVTPIDLHTTLVDKYFSLKAWVSLVGDPNQTDDTAVAQITSRARPDPPVLAGPHSVYYGSVAMITSSCPFNVSWFSFPSGGLALGNGINYTTFPLYSNSVIFAECTAPNGCTSQRKGDTIMITDAPVYPVPHSDNFDIQTTFRPYPGQGTNWLRGGLSPGFFPDTVPSQPNLWGTNLNFASGYTNNARCALLSPCFDFSDAAHAVMSFKMKYHSQAGHDGTRIEYSTNGGLSWSILGVLNDSKGTNWYNTQLPDQQAAWSGTSGVWKKSTYLLSQFNHYPLPVMFRIVFMSDEAISYEGTFIDDFSIGVPYLQDPGLKRMLQPAAITDYCEPLSVKVIIKNYGADTLFNIPVKYDINGFTIASTNWTGQLSPDSTAIVMFPGILAPLQDYNLSIYTSLPGDLNYSNDSICNHIVVEAPSYDVAIEQIQEPGIATPQGTMTNVSLTIRNKGKLPLSNIPLGYRIPGTGINVTETRTGPPLQQGEAAVYTFQQGYQFEYLGFYQLSCYSKLLDDCYQVNDSAYRKIESYLNTNVPAFDPNVFTLSQNYPNPADHKTQIKYSIPAHGQVSFTLTDYVGKKIMNFNETVTPGEHPIQLQTSDYPDGMYYYTITYEGQRLSRKMMLSHPK